MDPPGHYHIVSTAPEGSGYETLQQPQFVEYASQNGNYNRGSDDNYVQMTQTAQQGSSYDTTVLNGQNTQVGQTVSYAGYPQTTAHAMEYVYHMQFAQEMAQGFAENIPHYGSRTIITSDGKRKRRRIITHEQRKAANIRERRRMFHLNEAFDQLRKRVPTFAYEKKLSRIETLKLAVTYIKFMGDLVEELGGDKKVNLSDCSGSDEGLGTSGDSSTLDMDNNQGNHQTRKRNKSSVKSSTPTNNGRFYDDDVDSDVDSIPTN